MFEDPNFKGAPGFCENAQAPAIIFTSHTPPIGITFLDNTNCPDYYKSDAIVALHGSWNRKEPAGYQLVRVKFKNNQPYAVEDFISGWLRGYRVTARPVDVIVGKEGALYVSDDMRGAIYRVSYQTR
jgi:glucose/arabinose dehydrogenase